MNHNPKPPIRLDEKLSKPEGAESRCATTVWPRRKRAALGAIAPACVLVLQEFGALAFRV